MAISLQDFAAGDTNYVSKLNSNNDVIEVAVAGLQDTVSAASTSTLSLLELEYALFGKTITLLGAGSYSAAISGTNVIVQKGYAWVPGVFAVVARDISTTLAFAGKSTGSYYISLNISGIPLISSSSANAIYSVSWSSSTSSLSNLFPLATTIPTTLDSLAALTSTLLGVSYASLDARFEANEALILAGGPAWTTLKTETTKSVAGSSNVTLTSTESQARLITLTGALTGNINVTLNVTGPRDWVISNETSGAFSITVKGSSGTGTIVPQNGMTPVVWDGTNLKRTSGDYGIIDVPYAANITLNPSLYEVIRITLTGNVTFTFSGSTDGAKCILELTQDGSGGHSVVWPVNARGSTSVPLPTLTATAGAMDRIGFIYHGPSAKYDVTAVVLGY